MRPNDDNINEIRPQARAVHNALANEGALWRRKNAQGGLSPEALGRVSAAIVAEARAGDGISIFIQWLDPRRWMQLFPRPLAYSLAGAIAAAVWFLGIQPAFQPAGQLLFAAPPPPPSTSVQAVAARAPQSNHTREIARGQMIEVHETPGAVVQVGGRAQVLVREGSALRLASRDRIELTKGEVWIYLAGSKNHFEVDTPRGRVIATGTVFGISTAKELCVTVAEGKVTVMDLRGSAMALSAGQRVRVSDSLSAPESAGAAVPPTWTNGLLSAYRKAFFENYFPSARQTPIAPDSSGR